MFQKIIAFFTSIWTMILSLFGIGGTKTNNNYVQNLAYASASERQVVDIAYPENASGELNLVLFIHGGAWVQGDKSSYTESIKYVAKQTNYVAAAMNYRYVSDTTSCYDILDDITAALNAVKKNAADRGITLKKVAFTGASAGGHLSLLYAYKCGSISPITPAFVFEQCGPADLVSLSEGSSDAFAHYGEEGTLKLFSWFTGKKITAENYQSKEIRATLKDLSPITYVSSAVPTVIAHGLKDTTVPYENSVLLDNALTANGIRHDFVTYPNSNHNLANDKAADEQYVALAFQYGKEYF